MEEKIKKIMSECGIEGNPVDFLEAVIDFLGEYADDTKENEPNATRSINSLTDAKGIVVGLWMESN